MTDMVEKVARALFDASPFRSEEGPFEAQTEVYQRMCRVLAVAAVGAMREISIAERAPGVTAYAKVDGVCRPVALKAAWEAIIDAALSNTRESDNG